MAILCSCADDDTTMPYTPPQEHSFSFTGDLQVGDFTLSDAAVTVKANIGAAGRMDIVMQGVKFSDKMPVTLDITLCNLACTNEGGKMVFSGENIVPLIGSTPSADYTFATARGEFDMRTSALTFDAKMADNLAAHVAGKEFVYNGALNK